jgi:hypothetical protein
MVPKLFVDEKSRHVFLPWHVVKKIKSMINSEKRGKMVYDDVTFKSMSY